MRTSILIIIIIGPLLFASSTFAQVNEPELLIRAELENGSWDAVWSTDSAKVAIYRRIDALLRVYDIDEQIVIYEFTSEHNIQDVAWMPDGTQLLIGTTEGVVHVVDLETGIFLTELFHPDAIYHIRVSEDGKHALISGGFGTARMWDIGASFVEFELDPEESIIRAEWDEEFQHIRTFSNDGFMSIWDAQTGEQLLTIQHDDWIYGSTWNADGSQIVTYGQDRTARITDVDTGEITLEVLHDDVVYQAFWIADETQLITFSGFDRIYIWSLDGTEIQTYPFGGIALLEDGSLLLAKDRETIRLLDLSTGEVVRSFSHVDIVSNSDINSQETRLLTWTTNGVTHIWDIETGDELWRFESVLRKAQWSPDSELILTFTRDWVLEIWDMSNP